MYLQVINFMNYFLGVLNFSESNTQIRYRHVLKPQLSLKCYKV